jgi:SAM-dependent MidA family methyltransferase
MVLIIDYGEPQPMLASKWERYQIPLRAYYKHHVIDWRHCLYQSADITYDVDFFYLMFCWLECGGHVQNYTSLGQWLAQKITKEQGRTLRLLLEPRMMGQRFKFLELIK